MNPLSAIRATAGPERLAQLAVQAQVERAEATNPLRGPGGVGGDLRIPGAAEAAPTGHSFEATLGRIVSDVSGKQAAASEAVAGLMSGQQVPLHQAVIAMEEASVSFQLMVEVRNKLLESYQELMRMQV